MTPEGRIAYRVIALGSPEYHASIRLREAILRAPLGLTLSAEEMAAEPQCTHFAAISENEVVATLLLVPLDAETVKMRQVAVNPSLQGSGIGAGLVQFAEAVARERGFRRIVAHARATAAEFYRRLGYEVEDETFNESTIPHRKVGKQLR